MRYPNVELTLTSKGKGSVKIDGKDFPVLSVSVNGEVNKSTTVTMTFYASVNIIDDNADK